MLCVFVTLTTHNLSVTRLSPLALIKNVFLSGPVKTADSDLRELEEALQSDLEIAENLMLDSVKTGLMGSLQQGE